MKLKKTKPAVIEAALEHTEEVFEDLPTTTEEELLDVTLDLMADIPTTTEQAEILSDLKSTVEEFDEQEDFPQEDDPEEEASVTENVTEKAVAKSEQKIILQAGNVAIADLRYPVFFDKAWGTEQVSTAKVAANAMIEITIPAKCSLAKWVEYYGQLKGLGLKVVKYGSNVSL